jgi:cation-transporting ATPase 13A3/4/5
MSLYSAIQFTSVSFLYAKASNLGDFQFLFIDLLLILPIAIFMGWAGPAPLLCRKRPTADLVSRKVLTPLLGLMAICVFIQGAAFIAVREQPWYKPPKVGHEEPDIKNSENTALFLLSCFEYILSGVVLNAGPPFRQESIKNCEREPPSACWLRFCVANFTLGPFNLTIAVALIITTYMIISPAHWLKKLMELSYVDRDYKVFLLMLGLAYFFFAWFFEKYVAMPLARGIGRAKHRLTGKGKNRKKHKIIREQMWG